MLYSITNPRESIEYATMICFFFAFLSSNLLLQVHMHVQKLFTGLHYAHTTYLLEHEI